MLKGGLTILLLAVCAVGSAQQSVTELVAELVAAAQMKADEGDFAYAAAIIEKAIAFDTTNLDLRLSLASALQQDDDFEASSLQVAKVLLIDSTIAEAYNIAAITYQRLGSNDYALWCYTRAIVHARNDTMRSAYLANRSVLHEAVQDWDSALADLDSALVLLPSSLQAVNNRGNIFMRAGRFSEAVQALQRIVNDPAAGTYKPLGYFNLALTYTRMDSLDRAFLYFDTAATMLRPVQDPGNAGLYYSNLADAQRRAGRYREGITSIEQSIKYYPGNSYAYKTMGRLYLGIQKPNEACRALTYARDLGFAEKYGSEVDELIGAHCGGGERLPGRD